MSELIKMMPPSRWSGSGGRIFVRERGVSER
jgi:hypothetical protein